VTITIADVLKKIEDDLAWRAPGGSALGKIVLDRAEAQYLRDWAIKLILERDALLYESEQRHALVVEKEK
jgi:hypothetical protein